MKALRILFLALLVASCNAPRAVYDYDQEVDFSEYATFNFYPEFRTGMNELDERRLLSALENVLSEENLSLSENPDLLLNVYSEEYREPSGNSVGIGVGGGGGPVGVGVSAGIPVGGPTTYLQLTFDFIDTRTDALVWQAVVTSPFDLDAEPEERQEKLRKIAEEAFEGYPPEK